MANARICERQVWRDGRAYKFTFGRAMSAEFARPMYMSHTLHTHICDMYDGRAHPADIARTDMNLSARVRQT